MYLENALNVQGGVLYWAAGKRAGKVAGYRRADGYKVITFLGKKYLYHGLLS